MQWGKYEAYLRRLAAKGRVIKPLEQKPELPPDLIDAWKAFSQLSCQRGLDYNSVRPLRIADIKAWLDLYGYEGDDAIETMDLILGMDMEYFRKEEQRIKDEKESKKKNKKGK